MADEIMKTKTFEERMYERIRDSMGELMTDEELKKVVEAAMEKAFFEKRYTGDTYNRKELPSWTVERVGQLLQGRADAAIKQWLDDHPDVIKATVDEVIAKGMFGLVREHVERQVNDPLWKFANELRQKGLLNG